MATRAFPERQLFSSTRAFLSSRVGLALLTALSLQQTAKAAEYSFVTEHFPPFNYAIPGSNEGAGPVAEIVRAVCNKIKAQCSIHVYPWRRALSMVQHGEADGIFSFLRTPEREPFFYFSEPIVESAYAFFAHSGSEFKYTRAESLEGFTIAVYGLSSGTNLALQDILKPVNNIAVTTDISNSTVLKKLAAGRYGNSDKVLAALNRDVGLHLIEEERITGVKLIGDYQTIVYRIGFSRKQVSNTRFNTFNDALKSLIREGKVKAILSEYHLKAAP